MTDEHKQRLSELLDGELMSRSTARVLDAVDGDRELRAAWERYHLIGHVLRGESVDPGQRMLADRIRKCVAVEPVPLRSRRPRLLLKTLEAQRRGAIAMAASILFVTVTTGAVLLFGSSPEERVPAARLVERESIPMSRLQLEHPGLATKLDLYLVTHQATAPATGAKGMLPYATLVGYELPR